MREGKIGVFDSGLGGLNTLWACRKALPEAQFFYYGDNARAPYGEKSAEEIFFFTLEAFSLFERLQVDGAVIACNTATAVCAEEIRRKFSFPVVGLEPALKPAARAGKNILVLCTKATKNSLRLKNLLARFPKCNFHVFVPEGLVGEVERALPKGERPNLLPFLPEKATRVHGWDGVVLGCTHFEFLKGEIANYFGAPVFSGSEGAAKRLKELLNFTSKSGESGTAVHGFPPHLPPVVFLGSGAKNNKIVYENMRILYKTE